MMNNKNMFDGIVAFVNVVEKQSFTQAAAQMGHSPSHISKEVSELEHRLNVRLLNRTTRQISLTDRGKIYYERCRQIMDDTESAQNIISELQDTPRGVLRITAPVSFGNTHLCDALPQFLRLYPEINLEVEYNERVVDLVAEGIDVAIRVGKLKDSGLIAKKLLTTKGVVVASPYYLKRKGTPYSPEQLKEHDCISFSLSRNPAHWHFENESVEINPKVLCDSAELERAMALAGVGITRLPRFVCEEDLTQGKLKQILSGYERMDIGIYAVYPHRKFLSAKVRVFIDYLQEHFRSFQ